MNNANIVNESFMDIELIKQEDLIRTEENMNLSLLISKIFLDDHLKVEEYLQIEDNFEISNFYVLKAAEFITSQLSLTEVK